MTMCRHSQDYETCRFGCTFKTKEELRLKVDRLQVELDDLCATVQINCTPPDDCNDPVVLKAYMKACYEKAMEGGK